VLQAPSDISPDLLASPLYLLAVLFSARQSKDAALERVTRRRLDELGVKIAFGDEIEKPAQPAVRKRKVVPSGR